GFSPPGWFGSIMFLPGGFFIGNTNLNSLQECFLSGNYLERQPGRFLKIAVGSGLAMVTGALVLMAIVRNIYLFFLAITAMGIGTGLVLPAVNTLITSAAAREERGIITCLYGSLRFFGVALGPPAFGLATAWGKLALFLTAAALVALTTAFLLAFVRIEKILPDKLLPDNN
ncbi:MAG: transporter, family, multidrug resistance protein, partial [Clostridia bacterium]|nr:transporter, family, multidrug resistance protein [Clostridia bacterium]